jgi:membrane protein required for colicin V production
MNWLDIAIIIMIAIPALVGLKLGIIKILLGVVGVVVGVILAGRLAGPLGERLTFISDPGIAKVAAFAFILIAVLVLAAIAAVLLSKAISALPLGWVNRLGGAVLGLLLGAMFWGAVLTMWVRFLGPGDTITGSVLAGFLLDGFPVVLGLLPADFDSVRSFFK